MAQIREQRGLDNASLHSTKHPDSKWLKYKILQDCIDAAVVKRAYERAIESERHESTASLEISIQYHVSFGESLYITGSVRELGDWNPLDSVPLEWTEGDVWRVSVDVKRHQLGRLEYKFLVRVPGDPPIFNWEPGSNHNILALPSRRIEIRDRWGFPGYNHNIT